MGTALSTARVSLLDIVKLQDPNGNIMDPAEVLNETNDFIEDLHWQPSNAGLGNIIAMRSSLPTVAYTKMNAGVSGTKTTTVQRQDTIGVLSATNEIDVRSKYLAKGDIQSYRRKSDLAYVEAMGQKKTYTFFYGDERVDALSFTGLAARYASLSGETASYIVDAGGTSTDNTSIWVVDHGEGMVYGIYPEGTAAGLQAEDKGQQRVLDGSNNPYWAWCSWYEWAAGLVVEDYRHCVRIANIDVSDLSTAGESGYSGANLISMLVKAVNKMPAKTRGRRCIYANQTVLTALDLLVMNKSNLALGYSEWEGKRTLMFRDCAIRRVDQIVSTESRIT